MGCVGTKNLKDGTAFLEEKKYEEAVETFQKEIDKEKHLDEAYRGIGLAYYELHDYGKALESFEEALKQGTQETASLYNLMAVCSMEMEQYEEALKYLEKGLAMEDVSEELKQEMKFHTIAMHEKLGDWESAKAAVAEYTAEYPNDEKAAKEAEFLETR